MGKKNKNCREMVLLDHIIWGEKGRGGVGADEDGSLKSLHQAGTRTMEMASPG